MKRELGTSIFLTLGFPHLVEGLRLLLGSLRRGSVILFLRGRASKARSWGRKCPRVQRCTAGEHLSLFFPFFPLARFVRVWCRPLEPLGAGLAIQTRSSEERAEANTGVR